MRGRLVWPGCLIVLRRRKLFDDNAVAEDVIGCPTVLEAEDCQAGREEKCHGEVFDEGPQQSPAKSNIPSWIYPDTALANLFHAGTRDNFQSEDALARSPASRRVRALV